MDDRDILRLYDLETRISCTSPGSRSLVEKSEEWVRFSTPESGPGDNCVIYSRLNEGNADSVIAGQIEYFRSLGSGFEWKHYQHDIPADLESRLVAHGFRKGDSESLMVLELSRMPAGPVLTGNLVIKRIESPDQLQDVSDVHERVWNADFSWLRQMLVDEMAGPAARTGVYVAYDGSKPVCTGWMRYSPGASFASLWGGSTLPEYRNKGLYRAVVLQRGREAKEKGAKFATVDALPTSRPILEKLGFRKLAQTTPYIWTFAVK